MQMIATLGVLFIVVGVMGTVGMSGVNKSLEEMYVRDTVSTSQAGHMHRLP